MLVILPSVTIALPTPPLPEVISNVGMLVYELVVFNSILSIEEPIRYAFALFAKPLTRTYGAEVYPLPLLPTVIFVNCPY